MSHKIEKRYKVLSARSSEDITNEINYFCKGKKVESVTTTACSYNLQGSGLRSSDYTLVFIATITYEFDITEEKIQNEIMKFIQNKVKFPTKTEIDRITNSEEFKKFYDETAAKYEKEDE